MNKSSLKFAAAFLALSVLLAVTACTSIEPMLGPGPAPREAGDKAWAYVHPWYSRDWPSAGKWVYWVGPGH